MSINIVSVPFPALAHLPATCTRIWKFDGLYWLLDPDQATGGAVEWAKLVDKPQSIDALGIDNVVSSGGLPAR